MTKDQDRYSAVEGPCTHPLLYSFIHLYIHSSNILSCLGNTHPNVSHLASVRRGEAEPSRAKPSRALDTQTATLPPPSLFSLPFSLLFHHNFHPKSTANHHHCTSSTFSNHIAHRFRNNSSQIVTHLVQFSVKLEQTLVRPPCYHF